MLNSTQTIPTIPLSERDERRFWAKVALPNESGCMLWLGATNSRGYGQLYVRGMRAQYAHRIAYQLGVGSLPRGGRVVIDHLCRVRPCVAPDHLELVTQRENVMRGEGPALLGAYNRRRWL